MVILKKLQQAVQSKTVILLDLDNTLYAYDPCHQYAIKQIYRLYSKRVKKLSLNTFLKSYDCARQTIHARFKARAHSHSRRLYFQVMLKADKKTFSAVIFEKAYWKAFFKKMKLAPWVLPFLFFCRKSKKKVVIVTNLTTAIQMKKLRFLKLLQKVDGVLTSEMAGIEKPNPKIFRLALKKIKAKPQDAIVVGDDSQSDKVRFIEFFKI